MPDPLRVAPDAVLNAADPVQFAATIRAAVGELASAVDVAHRLGTHDLVDTTRNVLAVLQLA